jgi:hypothetical protein
MAKPINLYQGAAPAAMSQMGQGILEAGANIGRTIQGGYESMGKGLASGIKAVSDAYSEYKDDQAKFDASKKLFKAFGKSLGETERNEIQGIFDDTTLSTRQKNAITPAVMQYIGAVQAQAGREKVATIMADSRIKPAVVPVVLDTKVPTLQSLLDTVIDQPQSSSRPVQGSSRPLQSGGDVSGLPMNPSQGNPDLLVPTSAASSVAPSAQSGMPPARKNLITGEMEFWSPEAKRYVPEPKNELYFGPDLKITPY